MEHPKLLFNGSIRFIDFHTHRLRHQDREDIREVVSLHLGQEKGHQLFTVGMHPWWTMELPSTAQKEQLNHLLGMNNCLAMGEMGLDNLKGPEMDLQMDILRQLLPIAEELKLPVIIHCVRAYDQLLRIKKEFPKVEKWCIHGFGRHVTLAKQLIDKGFHLSIMPTVKPHKYQEFFSQLPNERLFLETDSMADVSIEGVYQTVSEVTSLDLPELCDLMRNNANHFFGK